MKILTVCLGNICRSPMAEGVLRHMAQERGMTLTTDSAGTNNYHVGEAPDRRAQQVMRNYGIDISDLRARQFTAADFEHFDLILAMDQSNLRNILQLATSEQQMTKVKLMMDYAPSHPMRDVPDPYFSGDEGFDAVYAMLMDACNKLLSKIDVTDRT